MTFSNLSHNTLTLFTARQQRWGMVMFSLVSICHSVHGARGSHETITHDALYRTADPPSLYRALPPLGPWASCTGPSPPCTPPSLLGTFGGQDWRTLQPPQPLTSGDYRRSKNGGRKRAVRILLECFLVNNYRPQGEGNVFPGVCMFTGRGRASLVPGSFLVTSPLSFLEVGYSWYQVPSRGRVSRRIGYCGVMYPWYQIPFGG